MATVADQLRHAREAKSLTVQQVAEITKIRTEHIRALEDAKYETFPAPVYIRGFVRTYAGFLKLDVDKTINQLNTEMGAAGKDQDMPASPSSGDSFLNLVLFQLWRVKWKLVLPLLIVAVALIIGIYSWRAWSSHKSTDPLTTLGAGLFQSTNEGETLPLPNASRR